MDLDPGSIKRCMLLALYATQRGSSSITFAAPPQRTTDDPTSTPRSRHKRTPGRRSGAAVELRYMSIPKATNRTPVPCGRLNVVFLANQVCAAGAVCVVRLHPWRPAQLTLPPPHLSLGAGAAATTPRAPPKPLSCPPPLRTPASVREQRLISGEKLHHLEPGSRPRRHSWSATFALIWILGVELDHCWLVGGFIRVFCDP